MRLGLGVILVLALTVPASAGSGTGTDSPFSMGAGARDLALGGSAITRPDPVTSAFWNPSFLARVEHISFGGFHSRLYEPGVTYQYVGLAVPTMDIGGFGVGVFRLGVSGIERCDINGFCGDEVDDSRLALYVAYGRRVSGYDLGAALNLERHSLDGYSTTSSPGVGISVSREFHTGFQRLPCIEANLNGRNLLRPGIKLADENVRIPCTLDAGLSLRLVPMSNRDHVVTLACALRKSDLDDPRMALGLEYDIRDRLRLCAGLRDGDPSFGAGVSLRSLRFDYAMVDRDLGSLHMFSIAADLGMAVSERRLVREKQRDDRFNALISEQLDRRNRELVAGLVARSQELVRTGDLEGARQAVDRAIFLAAGSGLDTTRVVKMAEEISAQLDLALRNQAYKAYMDSAAARMATGTYLEARYFASLALARLPGSQDAAALIDEIDEMMESNTTREVLVESRLLLADSLLSYGRTGDALAIAATLIEMAGDDNRVKMLVRKAEYDHWFSLAEEEFSRSEYRAARAAVDSALVRFPRHPSCLGLLSQIDRQLEPAPAGAGGPAKPANEPLSEEMSRQVEQTYGRAQDLFEKGDLSEAVSQWERVERLAPDYKSVREYLVSAYKYLGVELYTQNRLSDAVAVWKKAAILAPDNAEIQGYIRRTESEMAKLQELSYGDR